jgi:cytochrome c553
MRILKSILFAGLAALSVTTASADPIADGENVYKTKSCMACHGIKGSRPIQTNPALAGQNEKYLLTQLQDIKAGKRLGSKDPVTGHPYVQGMTDIMHLVDENDLKNVSAYLAAQKPGKPKPLDPAPTAEELANGEKAYKTLGCTACHSKDGTKPSNKAYPIIAGLNKDYLIRQMTEMRDKVRVNGQSKLMFGVISKAKDDQIAAIATWLSQIDRSTPAQ